MMESHCSREQIAERIKRIRDTIAESAVASGRSPESITLMAVTKTVAPELVNAAAECGVSLFGENRAQELRDKYDSYSFGRGQIHFIGTLQSNKVRLILDKVSCIQSVNSLPLAREISRRAENAGITMDILLEINVGEEGSKTGISPEKAEELAIQAAELPGIRVKGLMCIPPAVCKVLETERYFDQMHKLFVDIKHKKLDNISMETLSMGMSGDYACAIRHGATMVRIGTGFFGKRDYR